MKAIKLKSSCCGGTKFYLEIWESGDPGPDLLRWGSEHAEDSEQLIDLRIALENR